MKSRLLLAATAVTTGATLAATVLACGQGTAAAATPQPTVPKIAKGVATRASHARPARATRMARRASDFYVTATGSDANDGTSAHPWRTIQFAVNNAPVNSRISVGAGSYSPFVANRAGQTISGAGAGLTKVVGTMSALDGIAVRASNVTVSDLAVTDCLAKNVVGNGYENGGASAISVNAQASGATITSVALSGKTTLNSYGMNFGCYGVAVRDADHVTIADSDISGLGFGVFLRHGGTGTVVTGNTIHDNHAMIRNTPIAYDDFGGSAVGFNQVSESPGPTVSNNVITDNVAPSHDYVTDGGGFDLYGSSNVTIQGNTLSNNENILESGNGPGGVCLNDVFSGNVSSGRTPGSTLKHAAGMFLRCGAGMRITGNTFTNVDWWTFVVAPQSRDTAALRGLTVTGNTITQGYDVVWGINQSPAGCDYTFGPNTYTYRGALSVDWLGRRMANSTDFMSDLAAAS